MTHAERSRVGRCLMTRHSFTSPGGRGFHCDSHGEIWHQGKVVGKLYESDAYGDLKRWGVSTRTLVWSGDLPPPGLGFDIVACATAEDALTKFCHVADDVLDWREGKRVQSIYSKVGWYQKGKDDAR